MRAQKALLHCMKLPLVAQAFSLWCNNPHRTKMGFATTSPRTRDKSGAVES